MLKLKLIQKALLNFGGLIIIYRKDRIYTGFHYELNAFEYLFDTEVIDICST